MDRKGILIIIVVVAGLLGYLKFVSGPEQERRVAEYKTKLAAWEANQAKIKQEKEKQAAATAAANPAAPTPLEKPTTPAVPGAPATGTPIAPPPIAKSILEDTKTVASEVVQYQFTPHGAGIARIILGEHFADKENKNNIILNEFGAYPIGALSEDPDNAADVTQTWEKFDVDEQARTVTFVREDKLRSLRITKKFSLPQKPDENDRRRVKLRSEYLVGMDVTYENLSKEPRLAPKTFVHLGSSAPINEFEKSSLYQGFDYWRSGSNNSKLIDTFSAGGILMWQHPERPIFSEETESIRWGAVSSQYFTTLVTVLGGEDKNADEQRPLLGVTAWAKRTTISADDWRNPTDFRKAGHQLNKPRPLYNLDGAIGLLPVTMNAGETVTRSFQIYAGPREYRRLRLLDHDEKDVLDYGNFLGIIPTGWISRLLLNTMNFFYGYVTFHYALAIVLLTVIVKAILWPLQNKANKNMKKVSEMQPEMKKLQDKYKDDPQKLTQEMGKMWKKAGANPLSGCWPIFIQVPIFMGFYSMLGKAVELRHHGFLWVQDLAAPDTVGHLFGMASLPINPLPLLMAVSMLVQMKLGPQGGDPAQRKMMMFMPLIFVFFCYDYASALALYWSVQNIISIVQLLINRNKNAPAAKVQLAK